MKISNIILCLCILMISSSCLSAGRVPVDSLKLQGLLPAQSNEAFDKLRLYAKTRGLVLTENRLNKDGRSISLLDMHYRDCLAISADDLKEKNSIELFLYRCEGFDWKKERGHLGELLKFRQDE